MYKDSKKLESFIDESNKIIKKDRELYVKYLKIVETFSFPNELVIGGKLGINAITKDEISTDDYVYELYGKKVFFKAKRLATKIYDTIDDDFISKSVNLSVSIDKYKYIINVNLRPIAILYEIEKPIVKYRTKSPFSGCLINIVSVELVLITIYYKLCNPVFLDEWKELFHKEKTLIKLLKKSNYVKSSLQTDVKIINTIVKYSTAKNLILIGVNALLLYMFKFDKPKYKNKLVFISENKLENDANNLSDLLSPYGDFIFEYDYINLPFDIRVRKLSINLAGEVLTEIYNVGEFELVPYNIINGIKVGSPPLIMRFSLIELYINKLNKSLLYNTLSFNNYIKENIKLDLYFPTNYIGRYENYEHYIKKLSIEKNCFYKFVPYLEDKSNTVENNGTVSIDFES